MDQDRDDGLAPLDEATLTAAGRKAVALLAAKGWTSGRRDPNAFLPDDPDPNQMPAGWVPPAPVPLPIPDLPLVFSGPTSGGATGETPEAALAAFLKLTGG